jgi:uncharacterized protein YukE
LSFTADPTRIDAWSTRVTALVEDARAGSAYADTHLRFGPWPGAFSTAVGIMDEARVAIVDADSAIAELLAGSGAELARTAAAYRDTDRAEAERLDALYPAPTGPEPPAVPRSVAAVAPAAREDPASVLLPPVAADPVPDVVEELFSLPDIVSPAFYTQQLIRLVFDVDPLAHVASFASGDWNQFALAADALDKLAALHVALAAALDADAEAVLRGPSAAWTGEAADAAGRYFAGLSAAVARQAVTCRDLSRECRSLAVGMYLFARGVADGVKIAFDWLALAGALTAASAVAGVTTVVGGVVGAAAAFAAASTAYRTWLRVTGLIGEMMAAAHGFMGIVGGLLAPIRDVRSYPLPGAAYDHAGV